MLAPPAPAGVAENSSSPVEEFDVTALWCMFTFTSKQYCSCCPVGRPVALWHEPGAVIRPPMMYAGANSPWPTLMPPASVAALFVMRLLAIWMSCPQPCTNTPPPPCELSVTVRPSIDDGLQ